jgi:mono/diheme cytochrome c family protein
MNSNRGRAQRNAKTRHFWGFCVLLRSSAVLLLFACADAKQQGQWPIGKEELAQKPDAADATYRRYCIGCHGIDGKGNGGLGADFTLPGGVLGKADAELVASVRDGKRGQLATMPAHRPVLSDAQIDAVVRLVRQRFAPR